MLRPVDMHRNGNIPSHQRGTASMDDFFRGNGQEWITVGDDLVRVDQVPSDERTVDVLEGKVACRKCGRPHVPNEKMRGLPWFGLCTDCGDGGD